MGIIKAKQGRLPKVSVGLGVGSNSAYGNWEDQSLVSQLSVTIPLLDWGDNSRRVQKSTIQRNRKRQKIVDLVHQVLLELKDAERKVIFTRKSLDDAEQWYMEQKKWLENQEELLRVNRLEQLEILVTQLTVNNAKLELHHASHSHNQAIIQWSKVIAKSWFDMNITE
jgi:outer membrane protein TolC